MKLVTAENAYSAGCETWFVGSLADSRWARTIDWHLNLQFRRALGHESVRVSEPLREVVRTWEADVDLEMTPVGDETLMIASFRNLPNRQTILVQSKTPASWAKSCHQVWEKLGRPRARFFLPDSCNEKEFQMAWPKVSGDALVEFVAP